MTNAIAFEAADLGSEFVAFRKKAVAADNAALPLASRILAGLLSGGATKATVTVMALAAYGNPKTPKGKVGETTSALRYAVGGDAARKTVEAVFDMFDNVDVEGVRPILLATALQTEEMPRSFRALREAVTGAIKAATAPAIDAEASAEAEADNAAEAPQAPAPALDADSINRMALAIANADNATIAALEGPIAALMQAIADSAARLAGAVTEQQKAA